MADWRARGYVPDSDDEDDTQGSEKPIASVANEDFEHIDNVDEPVQNQERRRKYGTKHKVHMGGGGGAKKWGLDNHQGPENGQAKITTTDYGNSQATQRHQQDHEIIHDTPTSRDCDEIDELQQDHYHDTTATLVETELGRNVNGQIKEPNTRTALTDGMGSLSSSPLTELMQSSLEASPTAAQWASPPNGRGNVVDTQLSKRLANQEAFSIPAHTLTSDLRPGDATPKRNYGRRNLRHRNPIQLHPYAIECEKYRQILKARGVKPLRIAQMEAKLGNSLRQDTQEQEFDAGENSQVIDPDDDTQDLLTSSPSASHTVATSPLQSLSDIFQFEGDELPDMDLLLCQPFARVPPQGNKRRKTTHTFSKKMQRRVDQPRFSLPKPLATLPEDAVSMVDVPPSPPRSGSPTPTTIRRPPKDVFRIPQGLSPKALPTPVTSSEPRNNHAVEIFDDLETTDDSEGESANQYSIEGSQPGSPISEKNRSEQLKRVQRKMKGVLPASWLRIDLKTHIKKPEKVDRIHRSQSPVLKNQRGVASHVSRMRSGSPGTPPGQRLAIALSDDEGSDLDPVRPSSAAHSSQRRSPAPRLETRKDLNDRGLLAADWGEVDEDNRVDTMLPPTRRLTTYPPKRRTKGQTTLTGFVLERPCRFGGNSSQNPQRLSTPQSRMTEKPKKGRSNIPKFLPPRLSVLDATAQNQLSHNHTPQFLKIASRTARSRNDRGRHSPSRKFLRLGTADDTNDTNETLREWRAGTLAPTSCVPRLNHAEALSRQPLNPRSPNVQLPQLPVGQDYITKKNLRFSPRKIQPMDHASRPTKPPLLQSLLDNVVERRTVSESQLNHNSRRLKITKVKFNPKKRGLVSSSLQMSTGSKPAMLEALQEAEDRSHWGSALRRNINNIDQNQIQARASNILLARFFDEEDTPALQITPAAKSHALGARELRQASHIGTGNAQKRKHFRRKQRRPRRLDVDNFNYKPASSSLLFNDGLDHPELRSEADHAQVTGLGPFGTQYTDSFDVTPFSKGICFHQSTFIGSGAFAKSLDLATFNALDRRRGFVSLDTPYDMFRWGPWNDEVSGQLGQIFEIICEKLRVVSAQDHEVRISVTYEQAIVLLRDITMYFSEHLSFLDPVDRISCLQRCTMLVSLVLDGICGCIHPSDADEDPTKRSENDKFRIQSSTLLLVITNQLRQISQHELVPQVMKDDIHSLVLQTACETLNRVIRSGLGAFQLWLEQPRNLDTSAITIRENHYPIEALVVSLHITRAATGSMTMFWEILNNLMMVKTSGMPLKIDVQVLEGQWQRLYSLLPFLDFDIQGILDHCQRHKSHDNWKPVKQMIVQILEAYVSGAQVPSASLNVYCRALYGRCLNLINVWGWQRCESIIGTLFDFFARNNLAHLKNEESHGSPLFLEHLDKDPSLELSLDDRCFQLLLKIIGSGLKCMRQVYPEKKVRDIVWRLMPNHGRFHPKEEAIHQEDLDALRNHHDLLSTLYWVAPLGSRPRLSVIKNLVDIESSHREVCHINIRAWSNLVRFQLSTDESVSNLEPFADWYSDLLRQIIHQHTLARTEAEEQVRSAQGSEGLVISKDLLESTIAGNQRQVEVILSDALLSLKRALGEAKTREAAEVLLPSTLTEVFLLFDARRPQVNRSVVEALDVLLAYTTHSSRPLDPLVHISNSNDDSQDYGDWSGFDEGNLLHADKEVSSQTVQSAERLQYAFHEPLRHLLSNCFGADFVPDENLLLKLVEVWIVVARILVGCGLKSWSDYIGQFGQNTWISLRDTEQARKYTTYFLAMLVETDIEVYNENKMFFLTSWITSLAERESLLKFQHRFTSILLNTNSDDLLLQNLPFYVNKRTNRFDITAIEFSQRRLSLISSILSNMRESVDGALYALAVDATKLRQDYREILKCFMLTMKNRYEDLGHGSDIRGAYVDFVHRVVEFLQQHTSGICPVDRFFMDSSVFPLPATDPTYVVGQLKNYGLRLQESRTPKQLTVFLQSVSERAVLDGHQEYLVGQLCAAFTTTFEYGDPRTPTLRTFIVKAIVPAYIDVAFGTSNGWLLALPVLQAVEKVFDEMLTALDGTNPANVTAILSTIIDFYDCLCASFGLLVDHSSLFDQPKILKVLGVCYSMITAIVPLLDYITRLAESLQPGVAHLDFFQSYATFVSEILVGHVDTLSPETHNLDPVPQDVHLADVRQFALHELRETLDKNWTCHEEYYFNVRGNSRRQVMVDIGSYDEEKEGLMVELEKFRRCLGAMPALGEADQDSNVRSPGGISLEDILSS